MNDIINNIAGEIITLTPEPWEEILFYGRISESSGVVLFYFLPKNKSEYIYSNTIPQIYQIEEDKFRMGKYGIYKEAKGLKRINPGCECFTLKIESDLQFKLHLSYSNTSSINDVLLQNLWEYKYLGKLPKCKKQKRRVLKLHRKKLDI